MKVSYARRRYVRNGEWSGFTLVELLAVIVIIGILVGLLLPAVQTARESARSSQCMNQIKQLAIAMHNHENAYRVLPAGNKKGFGSDGMSPFVQLLPFIEETKLYTDMLAWSGVENSNVARAQLEKFRCPSDAQRVTVVKARPSSNYVFNAGDTLNGHSQGAASRGLFTQSLDIRLRFKDISDGLANTIAISEIVRPQMSGTTQPPGMAACTTCDEGNSWGIANTFAASTTNNGTSPNACFTSWRGAKFVEDGTIALLGQPRAPGGCWNWSQWNFWAFNTILAPNGPTCTGNGPQRGILTVKSYHRGGVNAAMADGSVRLISGNIDTGNRSGTELTTISQGVGPYGLWGRLGCRGDGQPIGTNDF